MIDNHTVREGAINAIAICLNVNESDRVWILSDGPRAAIGNLLADVAREQGAAVSHHAIEDYGARPMTDFPSAMGDELVAFAPTVTIYAAGAQPGELPFRKGLAQILRGQLHVRHAHMVGISPELLTSGMLADYERVAALTFKVKGLMERARQVHVTSPSGTDLWVELDNDSYRWIPFHGLYHEAGSFGNLPEGETCTIPADANGIFCASLLGDYFCERYGPLDPPMRFHIVGGRVTQISHDNEALADEVWRYLDSAQNGRRLGEFAIGTNEALEDFTGNLLQDEKFPGVHIAFGAPISDDAPWQSDVHVDAITTGCTIEIDGERIMEGGEFRV